MLLLWSADFFQNELGQKILSKTLSECQTVSSRSGLIVLSVLIGVKAVLHKQGKSFLLTALMTVCDITWCDNGTLVNVYVDLLVLTRIAGTS